MNTVKFKCKQSGNFVNIPAERYWDVEVLSKDQNYEQVTEQVKPEPVKPKK
jgi:hypothetical protein